MLELYFGGNKDSLIHEATKLIQLPGPTFGPADPQAPPDPALMADMGYEQVCSSEDRVFTVRDKKRIHGYRYAGSSDHTVILIHGVASSAFMYNRTAGSIQEATKAEVYAIDLRGHGRSDGNSGDVDHMDQYVDDLADVIGIIRKEKPHGRIIVAGHSMGGGVALRYAMHATYEQPDGFLLFAPLLGHDSPAFPKEQATEGTEAEPFMKIHLERAIGLAMLNEIGVHDHDSLPVLFFDLPEAVPLRTYSHRANMSMAPNDHAVALGAVNRPMLVLIGSEDEAFSANATKSAILAHSSGEVHVIEGATHNGVKHDPRSFAFIKAWFSDL